MKLFLKLKRWAMRRAVLGEHTGEPIVIGHAEIETDPDSTHFGQKIRRCTKRGSLNRRHIVDVVRDGYRHTYHATKGWRCVKES